MSISINQQVSPYSNSFPNDLFGPKMNEQKNFWFVVGEQIRCRPALKIIGNLANRSWQIIKTSFHHFDSLLSQMIIFPPLVQSTEFPSFKIVRARNEQLSHKDPASNLIDHRKEAQTDRPFTVKEFNQLIPPMQIIGNCLILNPLEEVKSQIKNQRIFSHQEALYKNYAELTNFLRSANLADCFDDIIFFLDDVSESAKQAPIDTLKPMHELTISLLENRGLGINLKQNNALIDRISTLANVMIKIVMQTADKELAAKWIDIVILNMERQIQRDFVTNGIISLIELITNIFQRNKEGFVSFWQKIKIRRIAKSITQLTTSEEDETVANSLLKVTHTRIPLVADLRNIFKNISDTVSFIPIINRISCITDAIPEYIEDFIDDLDRLKTPVFEGTLLVVKTTLIPFAGFGVLRFIPHIHNMALNFFFPHHQVLG